MKHTRHLTLTTITLLTLTACTTPTTGSLPEPDTSTTPSALAPSTTGTPQETTTTEEPNHSSNPTAPQGEYRPADEHGPAQNVPKPEAPEGMNIESPEAMLLFIDYWNEMGNYAIQTGDTGQVDKMVDPGFEEEKKFYKAIQGAYEYDGWVIGGKRTIHLNKDLIVSHGGGVYSIGANFDIENAILWLDGEAIGVDNKLNVQKGIDLKLKFDGTEWTVISADVVE